MTLRNRVTPLGTVEALPFRGLFMGNRGILHDGERRIVKPWNLVAWLICRPEFGGRRRELMAPGNYTELFFLDEVHALAAGHRPCFECRRGAFRLFLDAAGHERASALDEALHAERLTGRKGMRRSNRPPRRHFLRAAALPDGAMVLAGETAFARRGNGFLAWSREAPEGYLGALDGTAARDASVLRALLGADEMLTVLTPPASLVALANGYAPAWHPSATAAVRA